MYGFNIPGSSFSEKIKLDVTMFRGLPSQKSRLFSHVFSNDCLVHNTHFQKMPHYIILPLNYRTNIAQSQSGPHIESPALT